MGGNNDGFFGQKELATGNSEFNQLEFVVRMLTSKFNIATLVQVVAVTPAPNNTSQAVGTVDVLPLIGQVDGSGAIWPATTIFGLPYFRLQAGVAAILVDPAVGDVGLVVFCDKDISSVKASQGQPAGPASARRFDMADGFYFGGWMSAVTPTNYVQVNQAGISLVLSDGTSLLLSPGQCTIKANTKIIGTLEVTGDTKLDSTLEVAQVATFTMAASVGGLLTLGGGMASTTGTMNMSGTLNMTSGDVKVGSVTLNTHYHVAPAGGGSTGGPIG
jgi:hypothetical protein